MRTLTQLTILFFLLWIAMAISGCSPVFVESEPPTSRIVAKAAGHNTCGMNAPETMTLTTRNTRTSETSWSIGGKTGVGGKVPLGFLIPSLDIEAAISGQYGRKETRTWEEESSKEFTIEPDSNQLYVVYYREITRKGTIEIYGKRIRYEFPEELTIIGSKDFNKPCEPELIFRVRCDIAEYGGPESILAPGYDGIDRTWVRESPENGEILQVDIEMQEHFLKFHVQTDCSSGPCDWGDEWVCIWKDPLEVTYRNLAFKETKLIIHPLTSYDELRITVWDYFQNPPLTVRGQKTEYVFR